MMRGGLQVELPRCELCDVQDYCNVSAIGSDRHVVLCNPHHREFLAACKEWLRVQQAKRIAAAPRIAPPAPAADGLVRAGGHVCEPDCASPRCPVKRAQAAVKRRVKGKP